MKKIYLFLVFYWIYHAVAVAQNTVGVQYLDEALSLGGYTLLYPERQTDVFLINNCGEMVHQWKDSNPLSRPGAVAYLLENGNLLRAKSEEGNFSSGGVGGIIELLSWDNELLWRYETNDTTGIQHHDIHYMPNGNVLLLVWERMPYDDLLQNGFDTSRFNQTYLTFDAVLEVNPTTDAIVWEWHAKDHLVQDFTPDADHYGDISDHPERININYQDFTFGKPDFLHCNSLDYHPELDQILISVRNFNEIWVIDHSTTTAEAASSTGGNSGKGGDLLFRWGNPHAYDAADRSEQQLFRQHDAQWIDEGGDSTYVHFGKIALYNNDIAEGLSLGHILAPTWDSLTQSYLTEEQVYLPATFSATFSHPDTSRNYSTAASSIQVLQSGQVLMCAARQGRVFELAPNGELAWEYVVPFKNGLPVPQGTPLDISDNFTFQARRYLPNYPALEGKDLSPKGYIELDPNTNFCMTNAEIPVLTTGSFEVFPNPAKDFFFIKNTLPDTNFKVFDIHGRWVQTIEYPFFTKKVATQKWAAGVYFVVETTTGQVRKILVQE